ncbi:hypothetical protein AC579_3275 [Pseudocercospora musae]|uniref:GH16 domain-containing protein n=1 Tax=Pseudocercospora musae TaxID=113226 RepID=A0A139IDI5_9PEZI|nr:hypothetical protein AC579_3275 [Pseudocercospora musae]
MHGLPIAGILLGVAGTSVVSAQGPCNPTKGTCPPVPGFTAGFTNDFTPLSKVPDNWIIADYAEQYLSFSSGKGLEFRLPDGLSAPYIWTKNYLHYGKVEVTLQSAPGIGVISSAVLMSDTLDEIDWEWSGNDFALKVPTIQTNYFGHGVTGNWDRGTQPQVEKNMTQNFMTYTFDWKPESLTWAINGNVIRTLYAKDQDDIQYRYPQSPSRFHLGLWDAGYKDVAWYTKQWAGGETDLNGFPYSLFVKNVTITPYRSCSQYQATDTTGKTASFKCLNTTDISSSSAVGSTSASGGSTSSSVTSVELSASSPAAQTDKPDFIPTPAPVPPVNPTDSVGVNPTTSAPPTSSGTEPTIDVSEDEEDDDSEDDDASEDDGTPSTTSDSSSSCSGAVPTNTQPGTAVGCANYIRVHPGDTCESIADAHGIDVNDFERWNPQAGAECYNLWANYYVCASKPGQCSDGATAGGSDVIDNDSSSNDAVATPGDADEDSSGEDDSSDGTEDSTGEEADSADKTDGSDDDDESIPATGTTTEDTSADEEVSCSASVSTTTVYITICPTPTTVATTTIEQGTTTITMTLSSYVTDTVTSTLPSSEDRTVADESGEQETDVPSSEAPTPTEYVSDDAEDDDEGGDDATATTTTPSDDSDDSDDEVEEETSAPSSTPTGYSDEDDGDDQEDQEDESSYSSDKAPDSIGDMDDSEDDDSGEEDTTSESTPTPSSYADDDDDAATSSSSVEATATPDTYTDDDGDDDTEDTTPDEDSGSDEGDDATTGESVDLSPSSYDAVADPTSSAAATPTEHSSEQSTDDGDDEEDNEINDREDDGEDDDDTSDSEKDGGLEGVPAATTPSPITPAPSTPAQTQASSAISSGDEPAWVYMVDYSSGAPTQMSGTTTATIRVTSSITVTGCPSSVTSCPASKSTQIYITQTISSFTTVCPVSELPAISSWASGSDAPTGYMSSLSPSSYGTASAAPTPSAYGDEEEEEDDSDSGDDVPDDYDSTEDDEDDGSDLGSSTALSSTTSFQYISSTTTSDIASTPSSYGGDENDDDDADTADTDEDEDADEDTDTASVPDSKTTPFQFVSSTSTSGAASTPSSYEDDEDTGDTDTADVDEDGDVGEDEDEDTDTDSTIPSAFTSSASSSIISSSTPATPPSYATATSTPVVDQQLSSSTSTPSSSTLKPSSTTSKPTPTLVPKIGCWTHIGCYREVFGRALRVNKKILSYDNKSNNTNKACSDFCVGHKYFATEYGSECYCGDTLEPGCEEVADGRCKMKCSGNELAICGGSNGLSLYSGEECPGYLSGVKPPSSSNTDTMTTAAPKGYKEKKKRRSVGTKEKGSGARTTETRIYQPRGSGRFGGVFGWFRRR